jgi:ssDNA-binding Zn-finger/Zn-ribbon topoisomerase 1
VTEVYEEAQMPRCPEHGVPFQERSGRFGTFYGCPRWPNCDKIAKRSQHDGRWRVSDQAARDARKIAHARFDAIWKAGTMSRSECYRWLRRLMGLPRKACHIEHFDVAQCRRVVELVETML